MLYQQSFNNSAEYPNWGAVREQCDSGVVETEPVEDAALLVSRNQIADIDSSYAGALVNNEDEERLQGDARVEYLQTLLNAARAGFSESIMKWAPGDFINTSFEVASDIIVAQKDSIADIIDTLQEDIHLFSQQRTDRRLTVVSLGIILAAFAEAGYFGDGIRLWQKAFVLMVADYFIKIACGMIKEFTSNLVYPPFLNSPLITQPTGSGKTFAGLLSTFAMMIRTRGDRVALMTPRNGHMIWCVPTQTLVDDIKGQFEAIVNTEAFALLAQRNIRRANISKTYITIGRGNWSPDVKNRMICIMTYEYARTQLLCAALSDTGSPEARRPPMLLALRLCVVDEAHYLIKGGDRALTVDNVLAGCAALSIPVLMLTATPNDQLEVFASSLIKVPMVLPMLPGMHFDGRSGLNKNRFNTVFTATAVTVDNLNKRVPFGNSKQASLITLPNKLAAFKCLAESLQPPTEQRAIVFIQNIKKVQLVASYMCGMDVAVQCGGRADSVRQYLCGAMDEYTNVHLAKFEGRFFIKKLKSRDLVDAFVEGIADIAPGADTGLSNEVARMSRFKNFVTYMCFRLRIIPYFSGLALDEGGKDIIKRLILSTPDAPPDTIYRCVVTTSVVLEGVNISGAARLYITADGYKAINNTQYRQLAGRVGRHCDGFVDTWVPVAVSNGHIAIRKDETAAREDARQDVQRIIDSDDLVDRMLFMKTLTHMRNGAEGTPQKILDAFGTLGTYSITNSYFRGVVAPRISSFFIPARMPPELWQIEHTSPIMVPYDVTQQHAMAFLSQFNSPTYDKFFNMFIKQQLVSTAPRVILSTINYVDRLFKLIAEYDTWKARSFARAQLQASGQEITPEAVNSALPGKLAEINSQKCIPAALFVPLFASFSFAFDYANMDEDELLIIARTACTKLREERVLIEFLGDDNFINKSLTKLYMNIYPGQTLSLAQLKVIEYTVVLFMASLILSPLLWFKVFHVRFAEALSAVCPYLRALVCLILKSSDDVDEHGFVVSNPYENTRYGNSLSFLIDLIDSVLKQVSTAITAYGNSKNIAVFNSKLKFRVNGGERFTNMSIMQFMCEMTNFKEDELEGAGGNSFDRIVEEYLITAPLATDAYIVK